MSNQSYMIAESFLFKSKAKGSEEFVKDTGLDLSIDLGFSVPTANSIIENINKSGLTFVENKLGKSCYELIISNSLGRKFTLEFEAKNKKAELGLIKIHIGEAAGNLTIDFFKSMIKYHGKYLYCSDSGIMSLISIDKNNEQLMEEMTLV